MQAAKSFMQLQYYLENWDFTLEDIKAWTK